MKTLEEVVKYMYTEMVAADNAAFDLMGKVVFNNATPEEEKEFNHLSEKAMTIEDILLNIIDKNKMKQLLEDGMKKDNIHTYTDCFLFTKDADVRDDGTFMGWIGKLDLYTHSHEWTADEFWERFEKYL